MSGRHSKEKGKRRERELAAKLREMGFKESRRGQQYAGGETSADIVDAIPGVHIECKGEKRLRLWPAVEQALNDSGLNAASVWHRPEGRPDDWLVIVHVDELDDFCSAVVAAREKQRRAQTWVQLGRKDG